MGRDYTEADLTEMIFYDLVQNWYQAIPAKVIKYDAKQQKATVQPLIKYRDRTAGVSAKGLVDMPVIQGVPVVFAGTDECIISLPVKVGSTVLLHFSSRSIDNFLVSDGKATVDPQDLRIFDISDCFAIPLAPIPFQKALGSHTSDVEIRMNSGKANEVKLSLKANGDLVIDSPTKVIVNAESNVEVNTQANAVINVEGTTTLTSGGLVTIDTGNTTITGNLRVDGGVSVGSDVETDAGFSANNHVHIGNLSKPTSAFVP